MDFLLIGILLTIISTISLIFGYRIRELWPTTENLYENGVIAFIETLGVTFFALGGMFFTISLAKKKIIE
jgi:uncharacterized integral membrane protein